MSVEEKFNWSEWTKEQDKAFENCLALYGGEQNDRWEKIAAALTGKTLQEIRHHYEMLAKDLNAIESGCVPLPSYGVSAEDTKNVVEDSAVVETAQTQPGIGQRNSTRARKASRVKKERRKGIAWTQDEHRNFLKGLDRFGKGDWRSISRHCVPSRTPTQVASHAQKYYNRLNSGTTKQRKRTSIHDVTCEDQTPAPQGPYGENTAASASASSAITEKSPPPIPPSVGSITGHMNEPFSVAGMGCPVVGPPSLLSLPSLAQTGYGFNAPLLNECSIFDISDVPFC